MINSSLDACKICFQNVWNEIDVLYILCIPEFAKEMSIGAVCLTLAWYYAAMVRNEIQDETDRLTGKSKQISPVPIHLSIFSPNGNNIWNLDLPIADWQSFLSGPYCFGYWHALMHMYFFSSHVDEQLWAVPEATVSSFLKICLNPSLNNGGGLEGVNGALSTVFKI